MKHPNNPEAGKMVPLVLMVPQECKDRIRAIRDSEFGKSESLATAARAVVTRGIQSFDKPAEARA